ncbi:MAG: hypothetical protein ACFFEW_07180, partial [Candidatus Thorarchaeota archaeon]
VTETSGKSVNEMNDEEYIRMMLKKDIQRTIEREKRATRLRRDTTPSSYKDTLDENIRKKYFPDMDERPPKKGVTPEDLFVEEIVNTLVVKDVSDLASKMKQAVDFVQEEMGTSKN